MIWTGSILLLALRLADIGSPSPSILADTESRTYYLYAAAPPQQTGQNRAGVLAYKSRDLVNWDGPQTVFVVPDGLWANPAHEVRGPEVHLYRGRYYLLVTLANNDTVIEKPPESWRTVTRKSVHVFVGDSPTGPFSPVATKAATPEDMPALDGTLYFEADIPYMVYGHEWTQTIDGAMEAVRLKTDLSEPVGEPFRLFRGSDGPWFAEQRAASNKPRTYEAEGPFFYRTKTGKLLMLWSGERGDDPVLAMAYSLSGKIRGPWKQAGLLLPESAHQGTVFQTFDGRLMLLAGKTLTPLEDTGDGLRVAAPGAPGLLKLEGDLGVHDPVIMKEGGAYYVFCTGGRRGRNIIPIRTSQDMIHWKLAGYVFDKLPEWVAREVPKADGAWAPDISYFNGKYHLYYSVSSFGVNESAIGLATNVTLDPSNPKYKWTDEGMVVRSRTGQDDFNAIDPNLVIDGKKVWLNWGSFWGGIKMRRLDPATSKPSEKDKTLYSLASRPRLKTHVTPPVEGAIEAPFIWKHGGYWYLFASVDFCCRGAKSTYSVVVGRSRKVTGPYLDKDGKSMAEGGGSVVVPPATPLWHGAGHEAVFTDNGKDYLLFHAYDPVTGRPSLRISTLGWESGWPTARVE